MGNFDVGFAPRPFPEAGADAPVDFSNDGSGSPAAEWQVSLGRRLVEFGRHIRVW